MSAQVHRCLDAVCPDVVLLPPEMLRPTEETVAARLREVCDDLLATGVWRMPILVERSSLVVMDGHHRRAFALACGFARVPCLLLSYSDVELVARRDDQIVTPAEVISRGLEGRLYPAKSTRHINRFSGEITCNYTFEELRKR
jgi:hypothetical protein